MSFFRKTMNYVNYKKILLDAAKDFTWQGTVDNANFKTELTNFSCQDNIIITAQIEANGKILEILYQSNSCILSKGSAALFLAYAKGKSLTELSSISNDQFLKIVPAENFVARADCFLLPLNAIKAGFQK